MSNFFTQLDNYTGTMWAHFVFFEVYKCCGYSQFVSTYREGTLSDLHKSVFFHYGFNIPGLIITKEENNKEILVIPNDDTLLKDFMRTHSTFFRPCYPLPAKVVYRASFSEKCCGCDAKKEQQGKEEEETNETKETEPLLEEVNEMSMDVDNDPLEITIELCDKEQMCDNCVCDNNK